ncbi:MAG: hypothetical protein RLZZ265_2626, partial [Verrucomicrobiota bacterium]
MALNLRKAKSEDAAQWIQLVQS